MTNYYTNKLIKKLPKKYHHLVAKLDYEGKYSDLVDGCKFMLYFTDDAVPSVYYPCYPVKSISEAIYVIKCCAREL